MEKSQQEQTNIKQNSLNQQAREWFILSQSGNINKDQEVELHQWLNQSQTHKNAYKNQLLLWRKLGMVDAACQTAVELQLKNSPPTRGVAGLKQYKLPALAAALLMFCLLAIQMPQTPDAAKQDIAQVFKTTGSHIKHFGLPDGSKVVLSPKSQISYQQNEQFRQVKLNQGQVYFEVTKNLQQPFVVISGNARIQVTGTEFEIHRENHKTHVSVAGGSVEVSLLAPKKSQTIEVLSKNQKLSVDHTSQKIGKKQVYDANLQLSWLEGRLVFDETPFSEFVDIVSRYSDKPLTVMDTDLEKLTITTSFPAERVAQVLQNLPAAYPIKLYESGQNIQIYAAKY